MEDPGPFERLGGGPGDDGQAVRPPSPLAARLVAVRGRLAVAAASTAARWRAGGSGSGSGSGGSNGGVGGGGGSNGAAAHLLDGEDGEAATEPAPRPKAARTLGERLQLLKDALGDALVASDANRFAPATRPCSRTPNSAVAAAPAAAACARLPRPLLPEAVARLLSADDNGVPIAFTCPLTRELMADPVVAPDGFSYERRAIEDYLRLTATRAAAGRATAAAGRPRGGGAGGRKGGLPTSPMTEEPLAARPRQRVALVPNRVLAAAILEWGERALRVQQAEAAAAPAGGAAPPRPRDEAESRAPDAGEDGAAAALG